MKESCQNSAPKSSLATIYGVTALFVEKISSGAITSKGEADLFLHAEFVLQTLIFEKAAQKLSSKTPGFLNLWRRSFSSKQCSCAHDSQCLPVFD